MNTQKPDNFDSIMRRVNKLLAIANGNANENEAIAAASQAENIMRKYRIDHADLYLAKYRDEDQFDTVCVTESGRIFKWVSYTAVSCSRLFDVKSNIIRKRSSTVPNKFVKGIQFQGFKEDVQVAEWTFNYLCDTIMNASKKFSDENPGIGLSGTDSFRQAMSAKIQSRVYAYIEEQKKEEENSTNSTGRELTVAKIDAVERKFGKSSFSKRAGTMTNQQGVDAGRLAGEKVDIFRRAVGNTSSEKQYKIGV